MRPRPRMLRNGFATNETEETGLRSKTKSKSKSKERNNRAHVSNKNHFFIKEQQEYNRSTEVTALPPSFDWKLEMVHVTLLL
jgi:hypothetical protein